MDREWGELMAPSSMRAGVTVDELWAANKTLIVAYNNYETNIAHSFLWPKIPQVFRFDQSSPIESVVVIHWKWGKS